MLTDAQLQMRREGLTATDMTVLAGVSPYGRTAHDVYLDKMGLSEPSATTASMGLGNRLEPVALALLADERGLTISPGTTEKHPIMPWVIASPDGNVLDGDTGHRVAVAEAKAVGLRMAHRWGESGDANAIPDDVRVQVQWQMITTRTPLAHIVALLGTEARFYEVGHDEDLSGALLELGDAFWRERVLAKSPPDIDGSEASARMIRGLFRKATLALVAAPPEASDLVQQFLLAKAAAEKAEQNEAAAKARLCAIIGEHEGLRGNGWTATWKTRAGAPDWKSLAEKLGATKALAEEYRREGPRVLTVKLDKTEAA